MSLSHLSPLERFDLLPALISLSAKDSVVLPLAPTETFGDDVVEKAVGGMEVYNRMLRILPALFAIDKVFEQSFGYGRHVYVLGEDQLDNLLGENGANRREITPSAQIEILSVVGLIYRFNVARKFGYPEHGVVQFRLNGWGRFLIEERRLDQGKDFAETFDRLNGLLSVQSKEYRELLELCNSEERPLKIERIHELNHSLPITFVT